MTTTLSKISPLLLLLLCILFDTSSCGCFRPRNQLPPPQAAQVAQDPNGSSSYIVLTTKPPANEDQEHFSLRILSKALGGDKVANLALIYTYSHTIYGFAATLTPTQVSILEKQPEVLGVVQGQPARIIDPPVTQSERC